MHAAGQVKGSCRLFMSVDGPHSYVLFRGVCKTHTDGCETMKKAFLKIFLYKIRRSISPCPDQIAGKHSILGETLPEVGLTILGACPKDPH